MSRADKCAAVARGRGWLIRHFSSVSFANEMFTRTAWPHCVVLAFRSHHIASGDSCRVIGAWPDTGDGTKSCCRIFGSGGVVSVLLAMCYGHIGYVTRSQFFFRFDFRGLLCSRGKTWRLTHVWMT